MIACLPKTLNIQGKDYRIKSDYRVALLIFEIINDKDLSENTKFNLILDALYVDKPKLKDVEEALNQATWFLNGGKEIKLNDTNKQKLMDWNQDEQIIFSAINKVANKEVRAEEYLHWWTFLGYFNEIQDGLFSTIISIRKKLTDKSKKLEPYEKEFYENNKDLVDLKQKHTQEELDEIQACLEILNG